MGRRCAAILLMMSVVPPVLSGGDVATITVSDRVSNRVTRFMTGACLEDVNHEVYGGIYSQMLYGESFQEPALPPALRQFHVYGGQWLPEGDALAVSADRGAKIVAKDVLLRDGRVDPDIRMSRKQDGFAGLILKVREAAAGTEVAYTFPAHSFTIPSVR